MKYGRNWGQLGMKSDLSTFCYYVKGKVSVESLTKKNYVSTENLLPNKGGLVEAASLPTSALTQVYQTNDILISNIRPYFKKIWFAQENGGCSNDVLVIRAKDYVYPKFLYYVLSDNAFFDYSMATSKGTKMPRGDKTAIMKYQVPNFTMDTQIKIADILSDLDAKISLNTKINDNLERQAMAIYKSWFINYEPFNKIIPHDWKQDTIAALAKKIICGKTPATKISEYYGSEIPFITIPDMHNNTYTVITEKHLSTWGAASQAKKTLPRNCICVSCIGTAGLVSLTAKESQTNQQINSIIPKDGYSPYYIYLLMKTLSDTINKLGQSGSTIVNLNKTQFSKIKVLIPSVSSMNKFDIIVKPMFEMILSNQIENIKIGYIRDTLLPKLMSNTLNISNIKF